MIFKFRLLSGESENFICDIELKESQTFLDFHNIIQDSLKYETSQLATFHLCNDSWEKEQEILLTDMGPDIDKHIFMSETVLGDFLQTKYERLIYVFDLFSERAFYIELTGAVKESKENKYPRCTELKGKIPPQLSLDNIDLDI